MISFELVNRGDCKPLTIAIDMQLANLAVHEIESNLRI